MPDTARLADFSDREILHMVDDHGDNDGWVTTDQIAQAISGRPKRDDRRNARRAAGIRLSWLKRFGVIERKTDQPLLGAWRITQVGKHFLDGRLKERTAQEVRVMPDAQLVELLRHTSDRYQAAPRSSAILMRREWQRGMLR